MKNHPEKLTVLLLPALAALLLSACARPENLSRFETAWRARPAEPPPAVAEEPQPQAPDRPALPDSGNLALSVPQAVLLALENNQDLRVRRHTPEIAAGFEDIERGAWDAELFAELAGGGRKAIDPDPDGSAAEFSESDHRIAVGVRQQLPSGTLIEGTVEQERSDPSREPTQHAARAGISVTQALLRSAGPVVNLVSVRQAQLHAAATVHELRGVTEALVAATENAYWEYVLAGQEIDIFARSLTFARQQLDDIEQRIEVGVLPRIEAAAARAEVARRDQDLIDARATLETRRLRLVRLLNPAGDGRLDVGIVATSTAAIAPQPITDLDDRRRLALQSRPDLAEAGLRLQQNRLETIATENGLLPRLDLFIALGKTGYADAFAESFRNLDDDTRDISAGIRLSRYLDNRGARARDLAARAGRQQAKEAVENLRQLIDLDVRLAVNEAERARRQISATRITRELQEETLQAEKERFDVGASTALLVAQAQRDLLASAIVEAEAVINYRKALVSLYLAEGSLLERRGVSLGEGR